jgi:hypothetical protein
LHELHEASLLPACGHSFCLRCIQGLPAARGSVATPCPVSGGPPARS